MSRQQNISREWENSWRRYAMKKLRHRHPMHCIVEGRMPCWSVLYIGDLGGPRSARRERLAVDNGRRLADRQLPETEGAAREALQVAEDCRVAGKTSADRLLSVRARRGQYIHRRCPWSRHRRWLSLH